MKIFSVLVFILAMARAYGQEITPPCMQSQFSSCGSVYDSQGHYRGELSGNRFDPNSIGNPYGQYGSRFSPDSLNNPYGAGNPYLIQQSGPIKGLTGN